MSVRTFDGVDDRISVALGSLGFAFGPGTIAAIVRRPSNSASLQTIFKGGSSIASSQYQMQLNSAGQIQIQLGSTVASTPSLTVLTADGWCLIAVSKETGTATPRIHKYVFSTGIWTHANASGTLNNSGVAASSGSIGSAGAASWFTGDIAQLAVASTVLNDAAIESLISDSAWSLAGFVALWRLNQASVATAVEDDIGASDQLSIVGTSVTATDVPWPISSQRGKTKVGGAFAVKPTKTKVAGVFVTKPVKVKVAGVFI